MIFQECYFLLQLEIQNFDIVCSPVWTSRDRCCDLPSMVSINEPEAVQKNVINSNFNNINIRLVLNLVLTTLLNHSVRAASQQHLISEFCVSGSKVAMLELSPLEMVQKMSICVSVMFQVLGIINGEYIYLFI